MFAQTGVCVKLAETMEGSVMNGCRAQSAYDLPKFAVDNPKEIKSLNLRSLSLDTNQVIEYLAQNCSQLERLALNRGIVAIPARIEELATHCTKLTSLDLTDQSEVIGSSLSAFGRSCTSLVSMNLSGCIKLDGDHLELLPTRLLHLNLSRCPIEAHTVGRILRRCTGLKQLILQETDVTWPRSSSSTLTQLDLCNCPLRGDRPSDFFERFPALTELFYTKGREHIVERRGIKKGASCPKRATAPRKNGSEPTSVAQNPSSLG